MPCQMTKGTGPAELAQLGQPPNALSATNRSRGKAGTNLLHAILDKSYDRQPQGCHVKRKSGPASPSPALDWRFCPCPKELWEV